MSTEPTKTESETTHDPIIAGTKSVSLYVGNLPESVSDEQLFEIFSSSGVVSSTRVCRDSATGRSLGYGYINYHNSDDAENALKHQNFSRLNGREIRLMWSEPDSTKRRLNKGNIVVKNLDVSIDNKTLFDTFSVFGPILSSRVAVDENGETKCYGFVQYEKVEDAEKAISQVNWKMIAGKLVKVVKFQSRKERSPAPLRFTNVYVKYFTKEMFPTKESFEKFFNRYGKVTSVWFPLKADGETHGYGFVNFEDPEVAQKVVQELKGHNKTLYATRALTQHQRKRELNQSLGEWRREIDSRTAGRNVFIKNLPENVLDNELREQMLHYGPIEKLKVVTDNAKRSRCFGYVLFEQKEHAANAIKTMNGQNWGGQIIYMNLWQRKSEREKTQKIIQSQTMKNQNFPQEMMASGIIPFTQPPYMFPYGQQIIQGLPENMISPQQMSQILFERISQTDPKNAAKITGMFAEMPSNEMARMLENQELFAIQLNRAYSVLMGAQESQQE